MNRTIIHRGPDGEGFAYYNKENADVGLGQRRLSIIDLSTAATQTFNYKPLQLTYMEKFIIFLKLN